MKDLIYRQDAIDEIEYELEMINSSLDSETLDFNTREKLRQRKGEAREILNSIQQLPSAQPERKKGKWVFDYRGKRVCDNCGNPVAFALMDGVFREGNFCPKCGAEMEDE